MKVANDVVMKKYVSIVMHLNRVRYLLILVSLLLFRWHLLKYHLVYTQRNVDVINKVRKDVIRTNVVRPKVGRTNITRTNVVITNQMLLEQMLLDKIC